MEIDMHSPLKMPVIKKVKISAPKATPHSEYLSRRRGGLTESLDEKSKPSLDAVWLRSRNRTDADREAANPNPYVLPMEMDIFKKREVDFIIKQQEKRFFSSLPTQMKSTFLSRLRCRSAPMRSTVEDTIPETEKCRRDKTTWATVTKGCSQERENIRDYLAKQREMFMLQYSLSVKRDTIKQLEKEAVVEHHRISLAEKHLEDDSVAFEKFIKENDQNSVEAVKSAEKETMMKMEKTAEIKKVTAQMMAMKSDISKYQEILKEYQTYRTFLNAVAPAEWREEKKRKKEERRAAKQSQRQIKDKKLFCLPSSAKEDKKTFPPYGRRDSRVTKITQARRLSKSVKANTQERRESIPEVPETEVSDSDEEEPELCFSDARDMLNVLTVLEEQNLSYIQNFQETEEAMDEIRKTVQLTQDKMNNDTQILRQQIDILQLTIQREEEKTSELELKSRIFSYGEYRADKQDAMLNILHKKVKEVYRVCVGEVDSNIKTLHMLANIENKMEEVMDRLETLPPEKIDAVRTMREKEKRLRMREEKMLMKKHHQEERLKLALQRATSDSKKRTGRKLMPRSEPSEIKKKDKIHVLTTREQEDALYFFT